MKCEFVIFPPSDIVFVTIFPNNASYLKLLSCLFNEAFFYRFLSSNLVREDWFVGLRLFQVLALFIHNHPL